MNPGLLIRGWWERVLGGGPGKSAALAPGGESRLHPDPACGSTTQGTPTPTDLEMMGRALELARAAAERGEVPVGAVVYRAGQTGS